MMNSSAVTLDRLRQLEATAVGDVAALLQHEFADHT
jgi:hypothetical protein